MLSRKASLRFPCSRLRAFEVGEVLHKGSANRETLAP